MSDTQSTGHAHASGTEIVSDNYQRAALYLALCTVPDAGPPEAAMAQVVTLQFSEGLAGNADPVRRGLNRWIIDYWRRQAEFSAFRLSSPPLLRNELASIPEGSCGAADAARTLQAAEAATGARLGPSIAAQLRDLATEPDRTAEH